MVATAYSVAAGVAAVGLQPEPAGLSVKVGVPSGASTPRRRTLYAVMTIPLPPKVVGALHATLTRVSAMIVVETMSVTGNSGRVAATISRTFRSSSVVYDHPCTLRAL